MIYFVHVLCLSLLSVALSSFLEVELGPARLVALVWLHGCDFGLIHSVLLSTNVIVVLDTLHSEPCLITVLITPFLRHFVT